VILPLTHEHGTVRRLPLVTFAIMAICVVVQVHVVLDADAMRASESRFRTAMLYYLERPYLDADPRLAPPELADLLDQTGAGEWTPKRSCGRWRRSSVRGRPWGRW
jgi:hypothetical protein